MQTHLHAGQVHRVFGIGWIVRGQVQANGQRLVRAACPHLHARQPLEGIGVTRMSAQKVLELPERGIVLAVEGQSAPQADLGIVVSRDEIQHPAIRHYCVRVVAAPDL